MKRRYVLKNRNRFIVSLAIVFLAIFVSISTNNAYGYKEHTYQTITVMNGDTLWSIARKFNKKGDIRHYIYNLQKLNNLKDSSIIEGSQLKVIVE
ncbi:MAG: LysM peptidoglycan-binding domain-containing protein [Clostridiaceae bacterium]|nr:LysM peptidoglycan-binding domain-containing protein [Clostridiaceae bacterium]